MAIIVEGFDNSGKSTLAASFGLEVVHPGPRPKSAADVKTCLIHQLRQARLPVVMDRVTAISHPCYAFRQPDQIESDYLKAMLETHHCVLVYCRPPIEVVMDFSKHVAKSYDDERKIRWLREHAARIVKTYDSLMARLPHMKYDYTNPDQNVTTEAFQAQFVLGDWKRCKSLMNA